MPEPIEMEALPADATHEQTVAAFIELQLKLETAGILIITVPDDGTRNPVDPVAPPRP